MYEHLYESSLNSTENPVKNNKIKKILREGFELKPIIVLNNLKESKAYEKERELIELIGRKDLKLGPLTNLTNGGDGSFGILGKTRSKETKEKISRNNPMHNPEHRKKIVPYKTGEKNPGNIFSYKMSNNKNFWEFFNPIIRRKIRQIFRRSKTNKIIYEGITITRRKKKS